MRKIDYIDPIIGTVGDEQGESLHGGGKTHPGACYPGGLVQFSPDTVTGGDNGTGYNYCQNTIEGFSINHMSGIGWYGDLGNLQLMPTVENTCLRSGSNAEVPFTKGGYGWKSEFSHEKEKASVGYYSVFLERYGILAEATALAYTGFLRITYPTDKIPQLIFNFSRRIAGNADFEHIEIIDRNKIEGYIVCTPKGGGFGRGAGGIAYNLYFTIETSIPFTNCRFFSNEEFLDAAKTAEGKDIGLLAEFPKCDKPITVRVSISYTDLDGAKRNALSENIGLDFEKALSLNNSAWEKAFDCVSIDSDNETDKKLFYTCLYHTLLDPRLLNDKDGRFRTGDGEILKAKSNQRTMFSGWDVYRSEFPLLSLIKPEIVSEEVNSLVTLAKHKNSAFPRWELMGNDSRCMVGDPGLLVIADAYLKGICDFDTQAAYKIALASVKAEQSFNNKPFDSLRPATSQYLDKAFIRNRLSDTLEFLLADFAFAQWADKMGDKENAKRFLKRAFGYAQNYNKDIGFMAPKDENGEFLSVKDEYDTLGCVESNIFQQSFFAPFDVNGLAELFSTERFKALLEKLFKAADFSALWNENYNHSNEPCHNLTHYFNELGLYERTQYWTRRIQKEAYREGAFGFCGNEDVGQLSAWYVLSSIGFAQICIAKPEFSINTPLFKRVEVKLNPKYHSCKVSDKLIIECDKDPIENMYIEKIFFNGKKLNEPKISYEEITGGGFFRFELRS